jgi:hypothetical protein
MAVFGMQLAAGINLRLFKTRKFSTFASAAISLTEK